MRAQKVMEIGIVVKDLDKATRFFGEVLGIKPLKIDYYEPYRMRFGYFPMGELFFEVMEPAGEDGPIAQFVKSRGEGLHHIAVKVDNIDGAMHEFREKGVEFVNSTPLDLQLSYVDMKFAFTRPDTTFGVLLELIEEGVPADDKE